MLLLDRALQKITMRILKRDTSIQTPCPNVKMANLDQLDEFPWWGGQTLKGQFPKMKLIAKDPEEGAPGLADFMRTIHLDIASDRLKSVLEPLKLKVEFLPVTIFYKRKPSPQKYFVVNSLLRMKGLDLARSDVDFVEGSDLAVWKRKIVLDEKKLKGKHWVMVAELISIAVSEKVEAAIRASGCTGCAFVEPDSLRS